MFISNPFQRLAHFKRLESLDEPTLLEKRVIFSVPKFVSYTVPRRSSRVSIMCQQFHSTFFSKIVFVSCEDEAQQIPILSSPNPQSLNLNPGYWGRQLENQMLILKLSLSICILFLQRGPLSALRSLRYQGYRV